VARKGRRVNRVSKGNPVALAFFDSCYLFSILESLFKGP